MAMLSFNPPAKNSASDTRIPSKRAKAPGFFHLAGDGDVHVLHSLLRFDHQAVARLQRHVGAGVARKGAHQGRG